MTTLSFVLARLSNVSPSRKYPRRIAAPNPSTGVAAYSSRVDMRGAAACDARKASSSFAGGDGGAMITSDGLVSPMRAAKASSSAVCRRAGAAAVDVGGASVGAVVSLFGDAGISDAVPVCTTVRP